jgi:sulfite exporter TauE/SafE
MELAAVNTPAAAFVAGLVTSLHCVGMCGPLACLLGGRPGERADPGLVRSAYHGSRLAAYGVLGAAAGAVGAAPAAILNTPIVRALPWVLVAYFVFVGLKLGQRLPRLALLSRLQLSLRSWARGRPAPQVAAVMGAATPLLPCGPLYFLVAIAGFAGSPARGAELLLAFGLGTVPMLWVAQANVGWLRARLSPTALGRARTGLALAAAAVLVWRLRADLGLPGPAWDQFSCH